MSVLDMAEGGRRVSGIRDGASVCKLCGSQDNLSLCGGCRLVLYCSRAHQQHDWRDHKNLCKRIRPGVATRSGGSAKKTATEVGTSASTQIVSDSSSLESQVKDSLIISPRTTGTVNTEDDDKNSSRNYTVSKNSLPKDTAREINSQLDILNIGNNNSPFNNSSPEVTVSKYSDLPVDSIHCNSSPGDKCDNLSSSDNRRIDKREQTVVNSDKKHTDKKEQTVGKQKTPRKKQRNGENGNVSNSSIRSTPERYYLDRSTHNISLPSSASSSSYSSTMGQDDNKLSASQTRDQYLTVLRSRFEELAKYVFECLTKYGICVIDKFLGEVTGQEILKEVMQLSEAGVMKQGQLVHGPSSSSNRYIRGDMITWVDGTEPRSENIHFLISCMDAVMLQCAQYLDMYTINERTKAMVACYPGKRARYVRHVDNPNGDGRCITCIYYLNKDWNVKEHGGLLRIYPEGSDRVANIDPQFDRLLFFWSDRRNPHEVEESFRERYAITVWYYDAEERAHALQRFKGMTSKNSKTQAVPLINIKNHELSE